jgi:hypothetical protein
MIEVETPFFPQLQMESVTDVPFAAKLSRHSSYDPVDINYSYHGGHLYYPLQTLVRGREIQRLPDSRDETIVTERLQTVVVCSDRTIKTAKLAPAPPGTPMDDRVWRLGDLVLTARPRASSYASWRWQSIRAYLDGTVTLRPLDVIVRDLLRALKSAFYLPRPEDYIILAACIPVTFVQAVFESVPLLLLCGPAGTGKSSLGNFMARLCCNGTTIGMVSPASIARQIDESRGFVALDDLERIGRRKGRDSAQFTELVQGLKLSYNQKTAIKLWTDVTKMRTQRLNFYGVKLISNTTGTDAILGSRMLKIPTAAMPPEQRGNFSDTHGGERLLALRDELHVWAFTHVSAVAETYGRMFPVHSSRSDEIHAPLQVIIEMTKDQQLQDELSAGLDLQRQKPRVVNTLTELLLWTIERMIQRGQTVITPLEVLLEMRRLASDSNCRELGADRLNVAWVGRLLRSEAIIESAGKGERKRLYGHNLRLCAVRPDYIEHVRSLRRPVRILGATKVLYAKRGPVDFCERWSCSTCRFAAYHCPIRGSKLAAGRRHERENLRAAQAIA